MDNERLLASQEGVTAFLEREDRDEAVYELSRTQLAWVAEHCGIEVDASMRKGAILLKVVNYLSKSDVEGKELSMKREIDVLKQKARVKELELAEKKVDIEFEQIRAREREREREFELLKIKKEGEEKEREREREREKEKRERERESPETEGQNWTRIL